MFNKYEQEEIKKKMLEEIPTVYDKNIGSVMNDLVSCNSYIMGKLYDQLDTEIKNSFVTSADLGEGEECENLERIAYEKTFLLREPNKKSSGLLR
ncbi:MAG: hypothetical protein ACRCZ2_11745, partial [Fusobacteriaceae bacterium]